MSFSHVSTTIDKFADTETNSISIASTVVAGDVVILDVTRRKTGGITLGSVQFNGVALTQVGTDIDQGEAICSVYHGIAASSGTFNFTGTFSAFVYAIAAAIVMRPSSGGIVTVTNQNQNYLTGTFAAPSLSTTMASGDAVVSVLSGLGWDQSFNNVSASTWSATSPLTAQANGQNTGYLGVNRKYVATDVSSTGSVTQAWTVSAGQPQYNHNAIKLSQVASVTIGSTPTDIRISESRTIRVTAPTTAMTTGNTTVKINSSGNSAITPSAVTNISGLTYDVVFTVTDEYAGLPYSATGYGIIVTTADGSVTSANVPFLPVTGNGYITLTADGNGDFDIDLGTLVSGDQLEWTNYPDIDVDSEAAITSDDPDTTFDVRAWDDTDDTWGNWATQTLGSGGGSIVVDAEYTLQDAKNFVLTELTLVGALPDKELQFYLANGAVSTQINDAKKEFLIAKGITFTTLNDAWFSYLVSLGYSGHISDMEKAFWLNGGPP